MAQSFTLAAGPETDIWRKPPTTNVFNGTHLHQLPLEMSPCLQHSVAPFKTHSSGQVASFRSAKATFTASYTQRYDQAGLLFRLTPPSASQAQGKWIKTGIELYQGLPRLSTVACDSWADWSVGPVAGAEEIAVGQKSVSVLVRSEGDENGQSWWVYHVDGETETPLREICWIGAPHDGWTVEVAALVARPAKEGGQLEAQFDGFEVEWA